MSTIKVNRIENTSTTDGGIDVDSSGRLLVGTSSTSAQCSVLIKDNSGSSGPGILRVHSSVDTPADGATLGLVAFGANNDSPTAWMFGSRDGGTWTSGSSHPTSLVFSTTADATSSPTERMRIRANGEVVTTTSFNTSYAGTSTGQFGYDPQTGLPAAGLAVIVNRGNDGGGTSGVSLSRSATSWAAYSDERAKTDLLPINDGLSKISTLRSVTGRYLDDESGISRSFLIAQDVQAVLPEAVDAGDPDKLNLRYTEVIPLIVAALKESKERIETLEAEVAALKAS